MPNCSKRIRFRQDGKTFDGQCPDLATRLDDTNLQKRGGRPLCEFHYQQWLSKLSRHQRFVIKQKAESGG